MRLCDLLFKFPLIQMRTLDLFVFHLDISINGQPYGSMDKVLSTKMTMDRIQTSKVAAELTERVRGVEKKPSSADEANADQRKR